MPMCCIHIRSLHVTVRIISYILIVINECLWSPDIQAYYSASLENLKNQPFRIDSELRWVDDVICQVEPLNSEDAVEALSIRATSAFEGYAELLPFHRGRIRSRVFFFTSN